MKKTIKIFLVIVSVVLSLSAIALIIVVKNAKPSTSVYCIDELVSSLNDTNIIVEMLETNVTANEILSNNEYILSYRPNNGVKEFPENVTPSEVKIDTHGTFLLYYLDAEQYNKDYDYLIDEENTAFVSKILADDIYVENNFSGGDIVNAYGSTSYAPDLMNSKAFAEDVVNSDRSISVVVNYSFTQNLVILISPMELELMEFLGLMKW